MIGSAGGREEEEPARRKGPGLSAPWVFVVNGADYNGNGMLDSNANSANSFNLIKLAKSAKSANSVNSFNLIHLCNGCTFESS